MAAASSNEFQFTVPETAQNVDVKLRSDVTVPCHLSPEKSALNMEIKCVCVCKNRLVTEGRSYKGKANLVIHEGNVSLLLKDFKEMGDYLCQLISQDTTVEVTVQVNEYSDVQPVNQPLTSQSYPLTRHEENQLQEKTPQIRKIEKRPLKETVQEPETPRKTEQMKKSDAQPMSLRTVKYFVTLPGNRQMYHSDFLHALHRETPGLVKVSTVQESDVILHFHSESLAALKDYKRTDKPVVDIVLHNTLDSTSVPKSNVCLNNPDVFIVDCVICDVIEDLPECNINREAIAAVSQWLSTKIK